MEPTALFFRGTKDLAQRMPEAQGSVSNGEIRRMREAAPLQIKQQFTLTLRAFAVAIRKANDLFAAPLIRPDKN